MSDDKKEKKELMDKDSVEESQKVKKEVYLGEDDVVINAQQKIVEAKENIDEVKKTLQQNSQHSRVVPEVSGGWKKVQKPRYEIELYEEITDDESGDIKGYKKVPSEHPIYIEAASKADLIEHAKRYQFCHQRMKIVRCVDDFSQKTSQQSSQQPIQQVQKNIESSNQQLQVEIRQKTKPRFYKLGDIEVKEDNGKLYQRQWMKLSKSEASNFRLISDKNNAIVNLNGKHIEMKKWVQIENTEEDDSINLEDKLNG